MSASPLHPDPTRPGALAAELASALATVPSVEAIALFGSLAAGSGDGWSDIDMVVAHDDAEAARWEAAAALRGAAPVLYYRPIAGNEQPSGRYWFVGESPFHRLDISFSTVSEYSSGLAEHPLLGGRIVLREVYARRPGLGTGRAPGRRAEPITMVAGERHLGALSIRLSEALKHSLRGQPGAEVAQAAVRVRDCLAESPVETAYAGGDLRTLATEVLHLAARFTEVEAG